MYRSSLKVPRFFQACCIQAQRGGAHGSYRIAGYELTRHVSSLIGGDNDDEQDAKLSELITVVGRGDDEAVLAWFLREFPSAMSWIPKHRQRSFLEGIYQRAEDDPNYSAL